MKLQLCPVAWRGFPLAHETGHPFAVAVAAMKLGAGKALLWS